MKHKEHGKARRALCFAALLLALSLSGAAAHAAGAYEPLEAELSYRHVYTTTDTAVDSIFHYVISGEDGAPLPEEADENGAFSFQGVSGGGVRDGERTVFDLTGTLRFSFQRPGAYRYTIRADLDADREKAADPRYTLEARTVTVSFFVVNDDNGALRLQTLTVEDGAGAKAGGVELDPAFAPAEPGPSPRPSSAPGGVPKTGDNSHIRLYLGVMIFSGLALLGMLVMPGEKRKGLEDK